MLTELLRGVGVRQSFLKIQIRHDVQPAVQLRPFCSLDGKSDEPPVGRDIREHLGDVNDVLPLLLERMDGGIYIPHQLFRIIGEFLLPLRPQIIVLHIDHDQHLLRLHFHPPTNSL